SRSMNVGDDLLWSSLFSYSDQENDPYFLFSVDESNTAGVGSWYLGNKPIVGQNFVSPSDFSNLHYRATGARTQTIYSQAREQETNGLTQWSNRASVNITVIPPLMKVESFHAVESVTGDTIDGYLYDNTGRYKVGDTYTSTLDQLGGSWTYTI